MSSNTSNRSNATLIICEIIAAIAIIFGGAYWQFKATPAAPYSQLIGSVIDAKSDLPVADADVKLERTGSLPASTQTDSNGSFVFELPDSGGLARVRIEASGYDSLNQLVSLAGVAVNERIELQPSKSSIPAVETPQGADDDAEPTRDCSRLRINTVRYQRCLKRLEV